MPIEDISLLFFYSLELNCLTEILLEIPPAKPPKAESNYSVKKVQILR